MFTLNYENLNKSMFSPCNGKHWILPLIKNDLYFNKFTSKGFNSPMCNFIDGKYEPNQSVLSLLDVPKVLNLRMKVHQISFIYLPYHCKIVLSSLSAIMSCMSMINCLTWHSYPYFCLKWNKLVNGIKIYIQGISMVLTPPTPKTF